MQYKHRLTKIVIQHILNEQVMKIASTYKAVEAGRELCGEAVLKRRRSGGKEASEG